MKMKFKKFLLFIITISIMVMVVSNILYRTDYSQILSNIFYISKYIILVGNIIFLFFSSKIKVYYLKILLIVTIIYEIVLSVSTGAPIFPKGIVDIVNWPLTFLTYCEWFSSNSLTDKQKNRLKLLIESFMIVCLIICIPLIKKHQNYLDTGEIYLVYYLIEILPIIYYLESSKLKKIVFSVITTAFVLLSYKRTGSIAIVSSIAVYVILLSELKNVGYKKMFKKIGYLLLVVIILFSLYKFLDANNSRILVRLARISEDGGSGRTKIWQYVLDNYQNSNVFQQIFGHGFQSVYYELKPFGRNSLSHNSYLEYLYDYGIIGLSFLLLFIGNLVKEFIMVFKSKNKNLPVLGYELIVLLVFSLFSYFFEESNLSLLVIAFLGVLIGENFNNIQKNKI